MIVLEIAPIGNPMQMDLASIIDAHGKVVAMEKSTKIVLLVLQYLRGVIYCAGHQYFSTHKEYKEWLFKHFNVGYTTARRYMTLASLLKMFPRLLATDMNMSLLVKYNNMIREQFQEDSDLQQEINVLNSTGHTICRITDNQDLPLRESIAVSVEESFREDPTAESPLDSKVRSDNKISL